MPLLLLDLDNTLLPRDAAFRAWAVDFLAENGLPAGDVDWLVTLDGGGYVPRSTVLGAARRRYGFDRSLDALLAHYRRGINSHIHCPDSHVSALQAARAAGWTLGIVSNGGTGPQLEKIRRTGLAPLVDGWVISEEAHCLKPDPLIFEIAARRCGFRPSGDWTAQTWMVGDHAPADIAGAEAAGLRSVWLHHGRPWAERAYRPTVSAPGLPEAVGLVLDAAEAPGTRFRVSTAAQPVTVANSPAATGKPRSRSRLAVPASHLAPTAVPTAVPAGVQAGVQAGVPAGRPTTGTAATATPLPRPTPLAIPLAASPSRSTHAAGA
ncbi:HAD family hydrolase [Kitasatospora sp. NPDC049285]|uniref:HAD family hydrolase n=1 Tax=Kitasatospora sp. NPDC049285 TaxID=3157096 RepID=UPI003423F09B